LAKKSKKKVDETETIPETLEEIPVEEDAAEEIDPLTALQNEVTISKEEAKNNWDLYLRERADMENLRKRHQRDKEDAIRFANDRLLKEMVPVLDNLERAVDHAEQESDDTKGLVEGVNMTINQFRKALEDFGVKPINAVGMGFDPNLHQAMGHVESTEQAPNTVATEFQKGYLLHDRLLRPSLVMVTKTPAEETADAKAEDPSTSEE
jgi:molecular chaperone GrpE